MSLLQSIGQPLLPPLVRALVSTLDIRVANPDIAVAGERGIIYAFWHGKMLCGWLLSKKLFPEKTIVAVVSLSKDGQLLSRTLSRLGFGLIRGSSSRGGEEVKRSMIEETEKGNIVALTPDGPRGPLHAFKYGTLRLASEHRLPLVFAEISYEKALRLKSWDRFEIPRPFSAVDVTLHSIEPPLFRNSEEVAVFEKRLSKHLGNDC
ncbi:hypothetical protein CHL67_09255 [Prosthecochloris sp. GSB1]|uniref:lysophospholipid acyltransferase family protein n=1 Tax=Prosthecochloris sp. GSB1 TaxID=281093 RepID=UPI000B8D03B4|nr:lysophospholipid acyltransferase family protein [Prosthecochloris sp. GSB1]ASQ91078.1 hypothetical protein CHL67_09255 [Prosthecochloris sp. GSB1]